MKTCRTCNQTKPADAYLEDAIELHGEFVNFG